MKIPSVLDSRKILTLPVGAIAPNKNQPRSQFDKESLAELADSILRYGILQPLTVRKTDSSHFELVAGERRLRAAKQAGLKSVPCILVDVDERDSGLLALVENLQRRDLDYIEEAEGLRALIERYGMSQEEAARCISKSQSAVANKLRLLRLSPEILYVLREQGLSERHARALLRLNTESERIRVLQTVVEQDLTVARTEAYIDEFLRLSGKEEETKPGKKRTPHFVLKDVRIFLNTVAKGLGIMKQSGVDAQWEQQESEGDLILTIRIPKAVRERADSA